jgi:hypothetical protein
MPKRNKAREKADAAYLRSLQVDLEDDIAVAAQEARGDSISGAGHSIPKEVFLRLPESCPACGNGVQNGRVYNWTHLLWTAQHWQLQCGLCGKIVNVIESVWQQAKQMNRNRFGGADIKAPRKARQRRERGTE